MFITTYNSISKDGEKSYVNRISITTKWTLMQRTGTAQDLGVRLNSKLTFRNHVVTICRKGYRNLGFVILRTEGFTNIKAITTLYDALIRLVSRV